MGQNIPQTVLSTIGHRIAKIIKPIVVFLMTHKFIILHGKYTKLTITQKLVNE